MFVSARQAWDAIRCQLVVRYSSALFSFLLCFSPSFTAARLSSAQASALLRCGEVIGLLLQVGPPTICEKEKEKEMCFFSPRKIWYLKGFSYNRSRARKVQQMPAVEWNSGSQKNPAKPIRARKRASWTQVIPLAQLMIHPRFGFVSGACKSFGGRRPEKHVSCQGVVSYSTFVRFSLFARVRTL